MNGPLEPAGITGQVWVKGDVTATIIGRFGSTVVYIDEAPGCVPVKRSCPIRVFIDRERFTYSRTMDGREFKEFMAKPWHGVAGVKTQASEKNPTAKNLWELSKPIRDLLEANPTAGLEVVIDINQVVMRIKK